MQVNSSMCLLIWSNFLGEKVYSTRWQNFIFDKCIWPIPYKLQSIWQKESLDLIKCKSKKKKKKRIEVFKYCTIMNLDRESATSITMELTSSYMSSEEHKTKIHLGTTVLFFIRHLPKTNPQWFKHRGAFTRNWRIKGICNSWGCKLLSRTAQKLLQTILFLI